MTITAEQEARQHIDRVLEAKPAGYTLSSVEMQADKYATGLPDGLNPPVNPLPFLYLSTGVETRFINLLDPDPKTRPISRYLPHIHRPSTLSEWLQADTLHKWVTRLHAEGGGPTTGCSGRRLATPLMRGVMCTLKQLPGQIQGTC